MKGSPVKAAFLRYTDPMPLTLTAAADDDGRRLDRILRKSLPDTPLSLLHRLLRKGRILVDGKSGAADLRIRSGQTITVPLERKTGEAESHSGETENTHNARTSVGANPQSRFAVVNILFESSDFLVLNKPAGLAVHGNDSLDTLAQAYLAPKIPPSLSFRPGPLHRLDKPTSGVIVFSASLAGARRFSALLRSRALTKGYLALAEGLIEKEGVWEDRLVRDHERRKTLSFINPHPLSACGNHYPSEHPPPPGEPPKTARTRFKPLLVKPPYTLLQLEPDTGRTHQIRAQAAAHGHPLVSDRKYGSRQAGDLLLHAWFLETPDEPTAEPRLPRRIEAPPPEKFRARIKAIFGEEI
ncbi:ribosomal large subunit pseudouridine synthase C [Spirochaetia bacterium]|nr:ribosomal large subunit pseudouridine synthase C [Spirochaetia bacterium]